MESGTVYSNMILHTNMYMSGYFVRQKYMVVDFGLTGMNTGCSGALKKAATFSHEIRHISVQVTGYTLLTKPL